MVINNEESVQEASGMVTGEINEDPTNVDSDNEKRGRGRPAGSLNKSNDSNKLTSEVSALNAKIEDLNSKVEALQNQINRQLTVQNVSEPSNQSEKRLTVIQAWVEAFHQFLLTSRITNSADRAAEDELALIIRHLPDNSPIADAEG